MTEIKWTTPLEYVNAKNKHYDIDKDRKSKDPAIAFWDGITLYPEQSVKNQCPKCSADHQRWLIHVSEQTKGTSDRSDFKFQCNRSCFWYDYYRRE